MRTGALADILCIELGRVNELDQAELTARNMNFGPNTAGIEAAAANIRVLPIAAAALGGDVLGLSLASATAAANATDVDRAAPPAVPENAAIAPLPKTGGESAIPLTLALLAVRCGRCRFGAPNPYCLILTSELRWRSGPDARAASLIT